MDLGHGGQLWRGGQPHWWDSFSSVGHILTVALRLDLEVIRWLSRILNPVFCWLSSSRAQDDHVILKAIKGYPPMIWYLFLMGFKVIIHLHPFGRTCLVYWYVGYARHGGWSRLYHIFQVYSVAVVLAPIDRINACIHGVSYLCDLSWVLNFMTGLSHSYTSNLCEPFGHRLGISPLPPPA